MANEKERRKETKAVVVQYEHGRCAIVTESNRIVSYEFNFQHKTPAITTTTKTMKKK